MRRVNQMPATFVRPTYSESDLLPEEEIALRRREEEMDLRGRAIIAQHMNQLEQLAHLDLDAEKLEKLLEGVALLEKLDLLDEMHAQLGEIDLGEGFNYGGGGAGGVITKYVYVNVGGSGPTGERTAADIKREIEECTKVLFDPEAKEADITAANVNLERLYAEYEKSPEARAEAARKKEERRVRHEEENRAALQRLRARWTPARLESDQALRTRMRTLPMLRLVTMEPDAILKIHRADFTRFAFEGAQLEELRAVRANLPPFPAGMKAQMDWADVRIRFTTVHCVCVYVCLVCACVCMCCNCAHFVCRRSRLASTKWPATSSGLTTRPHPPTPSLLPRLQTASRLQTVLHLQRQRAETLCPRVSPLRLRRRPALARAARPLRRPARARVRLSLRRRRRRRHPWIRRSCRRSWRRL